MIERATGAVTTEVWAAWVGEVCPDERRRPEIRLSAQRTRSAPGGWIDGARLQCVCGGKPKTAMAYEKTIHIDTRDADAGRWTTVIRKAWAEVFRLCAKEEGDARFTALARLIETA